jgi:hypothetical protein
VVDAQRQRGGVVLVEVAQRTTSASSWFAVTVVIIQLSVLLLTVVLVVLGAAAPCTCCPCCCLAVGLDVGLQPAQSLAAAGYLQQGEAGCSVSTAGKGRRVTQTAGR